jgi:hypothetical protein
MAYRQALDIFLESDLSVGIHDLNTVWPAARRDTPTRQQCWSMPGCYGIR